MVGREIRSRVKFNDLPSETHRSLFSYTHGDCTDEIARMKFWVSGKPIPQGSKRIVQPNGATRARLIDVKPKELKAWRADVADEYRWQGRYGTDEHNTDILEGPVYLHLEFRLPRGKTVKRELPCVTPDLDKLCRAVLDALTGVAYKDDGQVVHVSASKHYEGAKGPGVEIEVRA